MTLRYPQTREEMDRLVADLYHAAPHGVGQRAGDRDARSRALVEQVITEMEAGIKVPVGRDWRAPGFVNR